MSKKKKSSGFVLQAGILAAAGIISRIIGLLYGVPLTRIISDEGNGYYSTAYNIYAIILLISTFSIPMAVSKLISAKLAFKEYKNAHMIFKCSLIYVVIVGGLAAIATYVFAPVLVKTNSVMSLRILAPTIFFSGILSVFRGYFQAHNTMVPTSLSQILEQILNAVVSVGAAWVMTRPFIDSADKSKVPAFGAAGGTIGTGAGVMAGLLFMLMIYALNSKIIKKQIRRDQTEEIDDYKSVFTVILKMVTPVIFATFIYNIITTVDMEVFYKILELKGMPDKEATILYGMYSRKYWVLVSVPIGLATAASTAVVPGISASFSKGNLEEANAKVTQAIKFTMVLAIPCAVGMSILAKPIMDLLFPNSELAAKLLSVGCILVLLYGVSTVTQGVLQGIGKVNAPVVNASIALVAHLIVLIPLLTFTNLNLYAILFGSITYSGVVCILNHREVVNALGYKQEIKQTFIVPLLSALIMGVVTFGAYKLLFMLIKRNSIALFVSLGLSMIVYFVAIIKLGGYTKEQLMAFPKGSMLAKLAVKLHLVK